MNDEYFIEQSRRVRGLAEMADPFTKKRLLALAESYDARLARPSRAIRQLPSIAISNEPHSDEYSGGGDTVKSNS